MTTSVINRMDELEEAIARGKETFLQVGSALAEIMETQLYKQRGFGSFAEYCETKWGFKKTYAYQLINSAAAAKSVSAIAEIKNEATARELARVPEDRREAVLKKAGSKPTARKIREAAVVDVEPTGETPRVQSYAPEPALKGVDLGKVQESAATFTPPDQRENKPSADLSASERATWEEVLTGRDNLDAILDCMNGHSCDVVTIAEVVSQLGLVRKSLMAYQKEIKA